MISPQVTVRLLQQLSDRGQEQERDHQEQGRQEQGRKGRKERQGRNELQGGPERQRPEFIEELTARETEIAQLVAGGATNAEIGSQLFIAAGTVKNHLATIQRKIGARNRVGIAAWVWETGS